MTAVPLSSMAPEVRLAAARGILADVAHHGSAAIMEACAAISALSDDPREVTEAVALMLLAGPER